MGLRVTIRKDKSLLTLLSPRVDWTRARYDSSSLRVGIRSHRSLNLQKFNIRTPQYGFNITVVFGFKGSRVWHRRIDPCTRTKPMVPEQWCRRILSQAC